MFVQVRVEENRGLSVKITPFAVNGREDWKIKSGMPGEKRPSYQRVPPVLVDKECRSIFNAKGYSRDRGICSDLYDSGTWYGRLWPM